MGKPRGSQALPNLWSYPGLSPSFPSMLVSTSPWQNLSSMAITLITSPLDSWEPQETTIPTCKVHILKEKKKKECNPVQTEGLQPMEIYRFLNPNKGCMSSKTTVPGNLSINTYSHARVMSQVLYLKTADFMSSTDWRNYANKISPLPS